MKLARILVFLLISTVYVFGGQLPDLVGFSDGKAVYVFLPHPVPAGQGVILWKKQSGHSWQKALPVVVKPINDPYRMQKLLGADYPILARTMEDPDPARILTKLHSDGVYSLMLCFKLPKLSMLLGRLLVDTHVKAGQTWQYRVEFVDAGGQTVRKTASVRVKIARPYVREVRHVRVKIAQRLATISFTYPKFNWQKPDWVVGFRLYRSTDGIHYQRVGRDFIFRLDNPRVTLQDGLLTYGQTYWYKVTTLSYFGYESKGSTPVKVYVRDTEPPSIVKNIRARFSGKGIMVSWDISPEPDVAGYEIFRGTASDRVRKRLNKTLIPALQTFYLDSTGREGQKYFYGVVAVDKAGNRSQLSARPYAVWPDQTPPPPPAWVKVRFSKGKLRISWKKVLKEPVRGYYVYRGLDQKHLVQLTPKPVGKKYAVYADTGNGLKKFQFGKTYWLAVRAVDMAWNLSDYKYVKFTVPDTIPPQAPTDIMVDIRKNGDVYYNWNPSPSSDVVRYAIVLREEGKRLPFRQKTVGTDTLRGVFPRLQKGKVYWLQITAIDQAGNRSVPPLRKKIEVRDYVPPAHPRNVFVKKTGKGYRLSWNKVVDFDFVGYRIYRAASPTGTYHPVVKKIIKSEHYLLPLSARSGYYEVRAVDSSGNESKKNEVIYIGR